tara:strand:- start:548 stop:880 length:333 start_codon:yes stop_codon:yes gene_type:complete
MGNIAKATIEILVDKWDELDKDGTWYIICINPQQVTTYKKANLVDLREGNRQTVRTRRMRHKRKANGLCPYCGDMPQEGFVRCTNCIEKSRSYAEKQKQEFDLDVEHGNI